MGQSNSSNQNQNKNPRQQQMQQQQFISDSNQYQQQNSNKNQKYDDDDEIIEATKQKEKPIELTDEQKQQIKNINDKVHLQIQTLYSKISKSSYSQSLPAMVSLSADSVYEFQEDNEAQLTFKGQKRPGIDIIFLLDKSGSMSGEKIYLLKECLSYVLTLLSEDDRVSLVQFESSAKRLTPLTKMTSANVKKLQGIVNSINAGGGTDFQNPLRIALKMIAERKYKNQLTSIFMLSDGQASNNYQSLFNQGIDNDQQYTIQTFGIGSDHDPELMKDLAQVKQGNFYYIENMNMVDECFADALGGIISVVAKNIKILFNFDQLANNQKAKIKEAFSAFWKKNNQDQYEIQLANLVSGSSKDFVFILEIPPLDQNELEVLKVLQASIEFTNIDETNKFTKEAILQLNIASENEEFKQSEENMNKNVYINYQRIQVADLMKKAMNLADVGENEQAQKELQKKIDELKGLAFSKGNAIIENLISDLEQAHKRCEKENYQVDGNIWFNQRNYMHMNQQGGDFQDSASNNIYSNTVQCQIRSNVSKRKK